MYLTTRLDILTEYAPEIEADVREKLRLGREKNKADIEEAVVYMETLDTKNAATK